MQRRDFLASLAACCAAPCIAPAEALAAIPPNGERRHYTRALLTDSAGSPLRAATLAAERTYIFHYPFVTTPCFLLDLGQPARAPADSGWPGGVGTRQSLVAYSAICPHKLTYPTRQISFISYRSAASPQNRYARVIHCCSEHSQFDPARGAKVLTGPAPHPLAAILLEYDPRADALYAFGTCGAEMFDAFFDKYAFRLAMEYGAQGIRKLTGGEVQVSELDTFCRQQVRC